MVRILSRLSWRHWFWLAPLSVLLVLATLFAINGLLLARDETPLVVRTSHEAVSELAPQTQLIAEGVTAEAPRIKIIAYNLAKGFVHQGGVSFVSVEGLKQRLDKVAALLEQEQPDLVFLSEAVLECGPTPVNQVEYLAEKTGMAYWAFGENFNFGLPGYRMVSGNAILSRAKLNPVANPSLAGRAPFYITMNNRRVLYCRTQIAGRDVLLGSIHTDSFNLDNNLAQTRQILEYSAEEPAILAGDFNCRPTEPSIPEVVNTGRYVGSTEDAGTFPADSPEQTIDFIFAPAGWKLIDHRVLESDASDHRPVVATFEVRWLEFKLIAP